MGGLVSDSALSEIGDRWGRKSLSLSHDVEYETRFLKANKFQNLLPFSRSTTCKGVIFYSKLKYVSARVLNSVITVSSQHNELCLVTSAQLSINDVQYELNRNITIAL